MWGVFVDVDGHKRGQTSRSFDGNEIQANSNFKAHVYLLSIGFYVSGEKYKGTKTTNCVF